MNRGSAANALAISARRLSIGNMADSQILHQLLQALLTPTVVQVRPHFKDGQYVVGDGEFAKYRGVLRQVCNAESGADIDRLMRYFSIVNVNTTLVRWNQADDHVETGGFTCTIGAQ
jgi:hypothetical protein